MGLKSSQIYELGHKNRYYIPDDAVSLNYVRSWLEEKGRSAASEGPKLLHI